ncbi:hypothetical protein KSP40_PGU008580 [Platanthera guangdongensis]|uniref:Fanconi Anaemia group E protein C-terminal domain-containing protein n=1 Tax=Platanthera guangdongensis TaxID=2320717 RepID=A0ABR2N300_9ASPA
MEQWVSLFHFLLNSPAPEGEAFLWFQEQRTSPPTTAAAAFLSLLLSPCPSLSTLPVSPSARSQIIYLQTLPFAVQTRVLSLLVSDSRHFCPHLLRSLASRILTSGLPSSSDHPAFWVARAARQLLDVLPEPAIEAEQCEEDEFDSLPHWLENAAKTSTPLLPWLPVNLSQLQKPAPFKCLKKSGIITKPLSKSEASYSTPPPPPPPPPLHSGVLSQAAALKAEILTSDSAADSLHLPQKFQQLCSDSGAGNELKLLELIEPWGANDETSSVLLLHLANGSDLFSKTWPSYVLCSIALPKLLTLKKPASRSLLSATISFCKQHQTAAVEALILPLVLLKEGINSVLCDVLMRIIKECLNKFHVSAVCQRLLCGGGEGRMPVCLPRHKDLISEQVVWTESTFDFFRHILNLEVYFTPDTNDKLVSAVVEMAAKLSKSLKFGNFLLCFVTKGSLAVSNHKTLLREAAEKTNTLVTRSIILRLNA